MDDVARRAHLSDRWQVTSDKWQVTGDKWREASDRWQVTGDKWQVTSDRWQVTGGKWQVTGGKWQVTSDKWRVTSRMWRVKHQLVTCYLLPLTFWYYNNHFYDYIIIIIYETKRDFGIKNCQLSESEREKIVYDGASKRNLIVGWFLKNWFSVLFNFFDTQLNNKLSWRVIDTENLN